MICLRMQQEQTHRELKSRFRMLSLSGCDDELIQKMMAIMIMGLLSSLSSSVLQVDRFI